MVVAPLPDTRDCRDRYVSTPLFRGCALLTIAIMGSGGVGGFFGGCLARAGQDVAFIARGAHLEAIQSNGLRVESTALGDFMVRPARATDDPADVGPVDIVLFCVKSWDLEEATSAILPMVGRGTVVIPLLNGVEAADRIAAVVGKEHVLGGVAHLESTIAEPGVIRQTSQKLHDLTFGELDGHTSPRVEQTLATLRTGGFNARASDRLVPALWEKFILICGISGVCSVTRLPIGVVRQHPETRAMVEEAMREVAALATARRVPLGEDAVAQQMAKVDLFAAAAKPSMLRDVERGGRLEVDALNGAAVRLGKELVIPTPVNAFVHACLSPLSRGARAGRADGQTREGPAQGPGGPGAERGRPA